MPGITLNDARGESVRWRFSLDAAHTQHRSLTKANNLKL